MNHMPQGYNRVEDALHDASNASSPAQTVTILFAAIRLQQQQIAELEKAVGVHDEGALNGIRIRARRLIEAAGRNPLLP